MSAVLTHNLPSWAESQAPTNIVTKWDHEAKLRQPRAPSSDTGVTVMEDHGDHEEFMVSRCVADWWGPEMANFWMLWSLWCGVLS